MADSLIPEGTRALIGEPSSHEHVGDVCKNGRRGSIGARLTIHGVQGLSLIHI